MNIIAPNFANIPQELQERHQWVCWKLVLKEGQAKPSKVPYDAKTDRTASVSASATWSSFDKTKTAYESGGYDGVGYVFSDEDPFTGIDLDEMRDPITGDLTEECKAIIATLWSYTEVSPSGGGIHTIVKAKLPDDAWHKTKIESGDVEMYNSKRFFTITGISHNDKPIRLIEDRQDEVTDLQKMLKKPTGNSANTANIAHDGLESNGQLCECANTAHMSPDSNSDLFDLGDQALLHCASSARNGDKFRSLWSGDTTGHKDDDSSADMALCSMLAFWTGKNSTQMDRLFRESGLMRPKWDERRGQETYGELTIRKANMFCREVYGKKSSQEGGRKPIPFDFMTPDPILPEMVPGILRVFSEALAEAVQVPFELPLLNVLGSVAVAVQGKVVVRVKSGYAEGLNLYALAPLPPGERKSSTVEACKRPLNEWERTKRQEMANEIKVAESERKTFEKAIEHSRGKAAKAKTEPERRKLFDEIKLLELSMPEIPKVPRLLADDVTPEQLAVLMDEQHGRIGVLEAEGGLFDTIGGRYSNGVPNMDVVLKAWGGETVHVDRKVGKPICLYNPRLTMVISPQPEVVRGLANKPGFRGRGLLGRFLFVMPQSRLGGRKAEPETMPLHLTTAWHDLLTGLLDIRPTFDELGEETAHEVTLTPEAYTLWREFWDSVEVELKSGGVFENIRDWAGKFPGQAIRLAGLFHMATVSTPLNCAISLETMQYALAVATTLADHALATFELMGSDPATDCAKSLLSWILSDRVESFTARDALEKVKGRFPNMEAVRPGLNLLEERAYITAADGSDRPGPGRKPSQNYTVNPLALDA